MADIAMTTMYEWNKNRIKALKGMSPYKIDEHKKDVVNFMMDTSNSYYMLLCRERNDYTIFKTDTTLEGSKYNTNVILNEILPTRGTLKEIEKNDEQGTIEFWVENQDGVFLYLFFPCDTFVIDEV